MVIDCWKETKDEAVEAAFNSANTGAISAIMLGLSQEKKIFKRIKPRAEAVLIRPRENL